MVAWKSRFPTLQDRIVFNDPKEKIYVGTTIKYLVSVFDIANLERDDIDLNYSSSNTSLADFDDYGNLTVLKPGNLTITVSADDIKKTLKVKLLKNPVAKISLKSKQDEIRTGDVIQFEAKALNRSGKEIKDAPINFSYRGKADYGIGLPASALIENKGGELFEESSRALSRYGKILVIGFASGKIPKFPINLALVKEFDIVGVFWGAFTRNNTDTFKENMNELFNWFKDGKINPQIEEKFKLQDASKALDKILNRGTKGKVILYPWLKSTLNKANYKFVNFK